MQSPIITPTAGESGSDQFNVKYFDEEAYLAQTWQLYAEAVVLALEKIYCIAPSFRAEKSRTTRHLTEYWHAEVETAWQDLEGLIALAEGLIVHIIKTVIRERKRELEFFEINVKKLQEIKAPFKRITYDEALMILKKRGVETAWGKDLRTLEEREILDEFGNKPVFVTHFPKQIKAFYMPRDPEKPETARCFDLLAPGVGEIIGASERDLDIDEMKKSLTAAGEKVETYDWYFDTRRYGSVPHAGFGLGVERVVQWLTGLEHIRDTIAFPRTLNRFRP